MATQEKRSRWSNAQLAKTERLLRVEEASRALDEQHVLGAKVSHNAPCSVCNLLASKLIGALRSAGL